MAKHDEAYDELNQKAANEWGLALLEALTAAIRDGRADVITGEASNGFKTKPDSVPTTRELEYSGGGELSMRLSVRPGLFWIEGHPFLRTGTQPSE